jgi:uncharacterized protein
MPFSCSVFIALAGSKRSSDLTYWIITIHLCPCRNLFRMLIKVEFSSFAIDPDKNTPLVILKEANGTRMLPLPVGPLEASAIAIKTLDVTTEKPLTIDVAKCILEELDGSLARVIIDAETGGSLFARLEIVAQSGQSARGTIRNINCRPCDALALALRCETPLFVRETVFETVVRNGTTPAGKKPSEFEKLRTSISSLDTMEFGSYYPE